MAGVRRSYQRETAVSGRGLRTLILNFLLPPLGLLYMWSQGVFRMRGRMVLTAVAALEMAILLMWDPLGWMPGSGGPVSVAPVPGSAAAVTHAPDDETISALSNIDELLAIGVSNPDETLSPDATPRLTQAEELALKEEIYNSVVYSVYRGATYYHASTVCGRQSNGRALTVREALEEGLGACPDCDPPTP